MSQNQNPNQNPPTNQNPNQNPPVGGNGGNGNPNGNGGNTNPNGGNGNQNPGGNANPGGNQNAPTNNASSNTPTSSASTSRLNIPATAAAGGITFTQPPQTATSFYKIAPNQLITFGWNMTAIIATPTHLTVSAVCDNGNTYPVGPTDGIIPGTATEVVWDVYSYQQHNPNTPLAQATYTLHIWDDRGPDAPRRGGFLQANSALKFALYTPQAYTGIADGWSCSTCNGAISAAAAHPALVGVVAMFMVMFLSGFGLLRNAARVH